ncbi:MAG: ATP-binding protein [Anaerolineales bacterium]|nr:ATP-binding protein [Hyphomicrobiaceae bacterium]MCW5596847.1 ATP-binding protein [Rhodocyclaceae bacterium]MCW5887062.1 ATP-binding protein [Anaerolineales bacterium]
MESLGALGYSLEAAVADIVDNSISADAATVRITFDWNDGAPFAWILDDGTGMSVDGLVEAMRLGGVGPMAARRTTDLGRFGLGLKTASFSQCSRLTVATRQGKSIASARWDLERMAHADSGWELLKGAEPGSEARLEPLKQQHRSGTLVLWELLRTGTETSLPRFLEAVERVERHLAMIFHRYLDGDAQRLHIHLNGRAITAWDPFVTWHPATTPKPLARLRDPSGDVTVRGYVLPHRDRFRDEDEHQQAGGPDGWVAQQGFYVYRAYRLIVAGGWLGLGGSREWLRDEASQLARIRIDIPNSIDTVWRIDVRKATARPPGSLRDGLIRLAADVRRSARDVFAHRGVRTGIQPDAMPGRLWRATASKRYPYAIKREHPLVQTAIDNSADPALTEALLLAIERTVPASISATPHRATEAEVDEMVLAARALMRNLVSLGVDPQAAVEQVARTEPFDQVPDIVQGLKGVD